MLSCTPKPGKSLYEYVFEKLALIHKLKLPISDEDKVNLILGGIDDEQIKFAVEATKIKNPAVLASYFKTVDNKKMQNSQASGSNVSGRARKDLTNDFKASGFERNKNPCYQWSSQKRSY